MRVLVTTDRQDGEGFSDSPRIRPRRNAVHLKEAVIDAIRAAGGVPLLLPPGETDLVGALEIADALVVTGGDFDIHPRHFGEAAVPELGRVDDKRTNTELAVCRLAIDTDLPVLGLCGGMQALAVVAGGTLVQDIDTQVPGASEHQQPTDPAEGWHALNVEPGQLRNWLGAHPVVNSTHHQAVRDAGDLRVSARAEDGVIEAVELPNHRFCIGVQWHPELLASGAVLFRALIRAG
ncbi:MAG: gamma-glutamyl-gamma-aminobutyrate hydrolase family protein [Proteobacteria bacterium]|nr:gamma-glutamyl-gamma-aminobutyrate hydrolase family protein [Pseudomonadota bacterium]MCP4920814.1 gamma-glutamyl-gamma-aminobutyrate hydrolase family protein [Pseudomonadota bacterium]